MEDGNRAGNLHDALHILDAGQIAMMVVHIRIGMAVAVDIYINRVDAAIRLFLEDFGDDVVGYEAIAAGNKDRADARHDIR